MSLTSAALDAKLDSVRAQLDQLNKVENGLNVLARDALRAGGGAPTILNGANEIAVEAFLQRRIGFLEIAGTVARVLEALGPQPADTLDEVVGLDAAARRAAGAFISGRAG